MQAAIVAIMKSSTDCHIAGMGCFAPEPFGKGMLTRYYCGTQMKGNLHGDKVGERR